MGQQGHSRLPVSPGRPKAQLDLGMLQELADLGWGSKRIAAEYSRRTGEYVSAMTGRDIFCRMGSVPPPIERPAPGGGGNRNARGSDVEGGVA